MLVIELVSSEPPCPTAPRDPQAGAQQTTISLFPTNCQWILTVDVPEGCTTRRRRQKRPAPFTRPTVLSHTPNTSLIAPPQKDQHHWVAPPPEKSQLRGGGGEVLGTPALSPDSPEGSAPSSEVSGPASSRHLDSKSPAPSRGSCVPTTPPVPRGSLFSFSYEILPAKITWFCSLIGC